MKSVLVLGGSGLVGSYLIRRLVEDTRVTATYSTSEAGDAKVSWVPFKYPQDALTLSGIIDDSSPEVIVNNIAYPSVDYCETNKADAYDLHVRLVEQLCLKAHETGAKVIHLSSDYVYDGQGRRYTEEDPPIPLSYYGWTKLLAEKIVLNSSPRNLVFRPAFIYGWHPKSRFLNLVLQSLKAKTTFEAYSDQFSCPTLVSDVVDCVCQGIVTNVSGLYNVVGSSYLSRFDFALQIAATFGGNPNQIRSIKTGQSPQAARRPMNNFVDNSKATRILGVRFRDVQGGLRLTLSEAYASGFIKLNHQN
jgi:dTDP-4-dehydrorhamnose reductase